MKNIIRLMFTVLVVLFFSCASNAQERTTQAATMMTDSLKVQASLTDAQYKKAYEANLAFVNGAKALKESGAARREKAAQLKEMDTNRDAAMKGILDEKQYKIYLDKKAENRQKLREAIRKRRGQ